MEINEDLFQNIATSGLAGVLHASDVGYCKKLFPKCSETSTFESYRHPGLGDMERTFLNTYAHAFLIKNNLK